MGCIYLHKIISSMNSAHSTFCVILFFKIHLKINIEIHLINNIEIHLIKSLLNYNQIHDYKTFYNLKAETLKTHIKKKNRTILIVQFRNKQK